jgi:hypothetical protein
MIASATTTIQFSEQARAQTATSVDESVAERLPNSIDGVGWALSPN